MPSRENLIALILVFSVMLECGETAIFSTNPVADAVVTSGAGGGLSDNNYGGAGGLAVAANGLAKGAFQSVLKFDLDAARNSFDSQFGTGQWAVQSVSLQLTAVANNNPTFFNPPAAGQFNISFMRNDSWLEGTGTPITPTTDGISNNSLLNTYLDNTADQALGMFAFPGGSSGANIYSLNLSSGLTADIGNGDKLSLRLFAADDGLSYLFSSRANGSSVNRPTLILTAVPEPGSLALCGIGFVALARWSSD